MKPKAESAPTAGLQPRSQLPPESSSPPDTAPPASCDGPTDFHDRLAALCQDSGIQRFAMKLTRNFDLARDAIQDTYCAIANTSASAGINDLRRYFCATLRRQVNRLLKEAGGHTLAADVGEMLAADSGRRASHPSSPSEEDGLRAAQASAWFRQLRAAETTSVRSRSGDPQRYQAVIVGTALWYLEVLLNGGVRTADVNAFLIMQYPDYFTPGGGQDSYHKRLSRARQDVNELLTSVVDPDELMP